MRNGETSRSNKETFCNWVLEQNTYLFCDKPFLIIIFEDFGFFINTHVH